MYVNVRYKKARVLKRRSAIGNLSLRLTITTTVLLFIIRSNTRAVIFRVEETRKSSSPSCHLDFRRYRINVPVSGHNPIIERNDEKFKYTLLISIYKSYMHTILNSFYQIFIEFIQSRTCH